MMRTTLTMIVCGLLATVAAAEHDGLVHREGKVLFPIGSYELPESSAGLQRMVEAGINLIRCGGVADLDRVREAGAYGWLPVPVHRGAGDALEAAVSEAREHPALAVWEGPDEIVWTFTATSTLEESQGITRQDWWTQQAHAVAYAESRANEIIPNMLEGIALVRKLDAEDRPFWMNEARSSDPQYVRGYLDAVDFIGCDDYPVRAASRDIDRPVRATTRWLAVGRGKPVYMVLQAFSWNEIGRAGTSAYPSFEETRYMAYGSIAQGARGVLYWGSAYLGNDDFRTSLYAFTSELAALNPFLVSPEAEGVRVNLLEAPDEPVRFGVEKIARNAGGEWLVVLVNREEQRFMGTEVAGLDSIAGQRLHLLYGDEEVTVDVHGAFVTRMQPRQVKVFATSRSFETANGEGRDYPGE